MKALVKSQSLPRCTHRLLYPLWELGMQEQVARMKLASTCAFPFSFLSCRVPEFSSALPFPARALRWRANHSRTIELPLNYAYTCCRTILFEFSSCMQCSAERTNVATAGTCVALTVEWVGIMCQPACLTARHVVHMCMCDF